MAGLSAVTRLDAEQAVVGSLLLDEGGVSLPPQAVRESPVSMASRSKINFFIDSPSLLLYGWRLLIQQINIDTF